MISIRLSNLLMYGTAIALGAVSYVALNANPELALLPHKTALEYLYNYSFVFVENVGYQQTNGLFIIGQSCLGAKLFINLFLIMVLGFIHRYRDVTRQIIALIKFYFLALALACGITIIRIASSLPFCTWDNFHLIHNTLSLSIYFISGLALYFVMERKTMSRA